MISQELLSKVEMLRLSISARRAELRQEEARLADAEGEILILHDTGQIVEEGFRSLVVNEVLGRAVVSWKTEMEKLKGKAFVEELLAKAPREKKREIVIVTA